MSELLHGIGLGRPAAKFSKSRQGVGKVVFGSLVTAEAAQGLSEVMLRYRLAVPVAEIAEDCQCLELAVGSPFGMPLPQGDNTRGC
jgi:hypothetical protein